jgi:hypothetical protein
MRRGYGVVSQPVGEQARWDERKKASLLRVQ